MYIQPPDKIYPLVMHKLRGKTDKFQRGEAKCRKPDLLTKSGVVRLLLRARCILLETRDAQGLGRAGLTF